MARVALRFRRGGIVVEDAVRLYELKQKGYCCSQIILQMGLEAQKKDNPDLIKAVSGLCNGLQSGLLCGILTGAVCLLSLGKPLDEDMSAINELVAWFRDEYGAVYGGIDCKEILAGNPINRVVRCPEILAATYKKVKELLEAYGYECIPDG
jgi:hypothetical protein